MSFYFKIFSVCSHVIERILFSILLIFLKYIYFIYYIYVMITDK